MTNPLTDVKELKRWQDAILDVPDHYKNRPDTIKGRFKEKFGKKDNMTVKVELEDPFIGKDNERDNYFVKLVQKKPSNKYGTVYVVEDKLGRKGLFFNYSFKQGDTKGLIKDIDINDCFLMKATSKHSQSSYDGQEQTYFNRVQILKNIGSVENPLVTKKPVHGDPNYDIFKHGL